MGKTNSRRLLCLILSLAMVFALAVAPAFAAEETNAETVDTEEPSTDTAAAADNTVSLTAAIAETETNEEIEAETEEMTEAPEPASESETEEPTDEPTETPTEEPTENPTETPTEESTQTAVQALQAQIDALPTVDELAEMDLDEQNEVYTAFLAACEAYDALTEDEQADVDDSALDTLADYFNSGIMTLADSAQTASSVASVTIDGTTSYYDSVKDALGAVTAGTTGTVTLLCDATLSATKVLKGNLTFDLGGYTLTTGSYTLSIGSDANVTITNGSITGSAAGSQSGIIKMTYSSASLKMDSVTVTNTTTSTSTSNVVYLDPKVNITFEATNCSFTISSSNGRVIAGGSGTTGESSSITLTGCELSSAYRTVVLTGKYAEISIDGCTIETTSTDETDAAIYLSTSQTAEITITDTTITAKNCLAIGSNNGASSTGTVKISGDDTNVTGSVSVTKPSISITGGTYDTDVSDYVDTTSISVINNGDGTYTVGATTTNVASVTIDGTTTEYATFVEAVTAANAATSDATITLLADAEVDSNLTVTPNSDATVTLDLASHTLTIDSGATLDIRDVTLSADSGIKIVSGTLIAPDSWTDTSSVTAESGAAMYIFGVGYTYSSESWSKSGTYLVEYFKTNRGGEGIDVGNSETWTYPEAVVDSTIFAGWYDDVAYNTPCSTAKTSGVAYANFVTLAGSDGIINYLGSALKMETDSEGNITTDYSKTSLRLGYEFTKPANCTMEGSGSWSWSWWLDNDEENATTLLGTNKVDNTSSFTSNIVVTDISSSDYEVVIHAKASITYTTADGTPVYAIRSDAQSASVNSVAELMKSGGTSDEKTYAEGILSITTSAATE